MASNKNAQNSAPRDLKRTILVYMISAETLKVFLVTKFRVFYIYVSQNSM